MRSEGYTVLGPCVCLSVCLSVYDYSRTTGYEAADERYQQLQCYKGKINSQDQGNSRQLLGISGHVCDGKQTKGI